MRRSHQHLAEHSVHDAEVQPSLNVGRLHGQHAGVCKLELILAGEWRGVQGGDKSVTQPWSYLDIAMVIQVNLPSNELAVGLMANAIEQTLHF